MYFDINDHLTTNEFGRNVYHVKSGGDKHVNNQPGILNFYIILNLFLKQTKYVPIFSTFTRGN